MSQQPTLPLPAGFRAAGVYCGIKSDARRLDVSLFVSDRPASAAGVFTQNRVVGAPVKVSRGRVPSDAVRAVVINSGNSNACTGDRGVEDARWMTGRVAAELNCNEEAVLVCSTGIIGRFLPREKLEQGLPQAASQLSDSPEAFRAAAAGMMTTDTFPKQAMREVQIEGKAVRVCGAAKGAAMIAPNMATMLAVILTDAAVPPERCRTLLREAVGESFNAILIDGHTSTSDTVLLLANGAAGVAIDDPAGAPEFAAAVKAVCQDLARQIVRDAEGASHFVTVDVSGLRTQEEADRIARAICEGALVKTAIAGNDPNWGRIVSAAGYAGPAFEERDVSLWVNGMLLYEDGTPAPFDEKQVSQSMATGDVHIDLRFKLGSAARRMWTSDLTQEYVRLNSEYTT